MSDLLAAWDQFAASAGSMEIDWYPPVPNASAWPQERKATKKRVVTIDDEAWLQFAHVVTTHVLECNTDVEPDK